MTCLKMNNKIKKINFDTRFLPVYFIVFLIVNSCRVLQPNCNPGITYKMDANSQINLPFSIDKVLLQQYIDNIFVNQLFKGGEDDGLPFDIVVNKVGAPNISFVGNVLSFNLPLRIAAAKSIAFIRANATGEIVLEFESVIDVDSTWHVVSKSSLANYYWIEKPALNVLGMNVSVVKSTERLIEENKSSLLNQLDNMIYSNNFIRTSMDSLLARLDQPIALDSNKMIEWDVSILEAQLGQFVTDDQQIQGGLVIDFNITPSLDSVKKENTSLRFLWSKNRVKEQVIKFSLDFSERQIQSMADTFMKYAKPEELMFELNGKNVRVDKIETMINRDKIGAHVVLREGYRGSITYLAKPHFQLKKRKVVLCDAELQTDIKGAGTKVFTLLFKRNIKRRFTRELENYINEIIDGQIEELNKVLLDYPLGKGSSLSARIERMSIAPLIVEDGMLRMDIQLLVPGSISLKGMEVNFPESISEN